MTLPQLLHSTRFYGPANSAFSWTLLVLERGFLSYRLKSSCDRSAKDVWFGYFPVGALRKLPFILYSRPAEDWLQRSGSSSIISPTTLLMAARGRRDCSRSSTRRGSREYATTPASMPPPLRHLSRKPRYSGGSARHSSLGFRRSTRVPATAFGATLPRERVPTNGRNPPLSRPEVRATSRPGSCPRRCLSRSL